MRRLLFFLLLLLASGGCARRDWTDLLVLTDVTGTWTGTIRGFTQPSPLRLTLQQQGARVVGTSSIPGVSLTGATLERLRGEVEGVVSGEMFSFALMGGEGS
jgi:hypothetical protein